MTLSNYTVRLKTYLEKLDLMPKDILIRQGDESADLYFIELGQVSLYLEVEDNKLIRLQTLGMGTIVGELGFYLNTKRSASVIVDSRTFAYRLTREAMQTMKTDDPELAIAFNEMMLNLVAERLVATDLEIVALHR